MWGAFVETNFDGNVEVDGCGDDEVEAESCGDGEVEARASADIKGSFTGMWGSFSDMWGSFSDMWGALVKTYFEVEVKGRGGS